MRGTRTTALIMTGVIIVEGAPLVAIGIGAGGWARLARLLGWHAPPISALAWLLAAAVAVIYAGLSMTSLPFIRVHARDFTWLKLLSLPFALITGTFEELFFRQWLMDALAARSWPSLAQIALSGIGFGVAHAFWGLLGRNLVAAGKSMLFTTGLGVALAVVYLLSGRQLAPAAWSHTAINLLIEPWLMLAVINLRRSPA